MGLYIFLAFTLSAGLVWAQFDPLSGLGSGSGGSGGTNITDLDALTDPTDTPTNTNTEDVQTTNSTTPANTNTTEPTTGEITLAECIIYQKLEIEDERCDTLLREMSCPKYAECLSSCEIYKEGCFSDGTGPFNSKPYSACLAESISCHDRCSVLYPICGSKYPPTIEGVRAEPIAMSDLEGDVRITYEDDPRAVDMETVRSDRNIHTGAAIFTGDDGQVTITLPNGATQWIGPGTYFRIADYTETDNTQNWLALLPNGDVKVKIENTKNQKIGYTIITPRGKVRAKGTEFSLKVIDDGAMQLETMSGVVELLDHADNSLAFIGAGENLTQNSAGEITDYSSGVSFPYGAPESSISSRTSTTVIIGIIAAAVLGLGLLVGIIILLIRHKRKKLQ